MSPEDAKTQGRAAREWMPAGRPAEGAWPAPLVREGGETMKAEGCCTLRAVLSRTEVR